MPLWTPKAEVGVDFTLAEIGDVKFVWSEVQEGICKRKAFSERAGLQWVLVFVNYRIVPVFAGEMDR